MIVAHVCGNGYNEVSMEYTELFGVFTSLASFEKEALE